MMFFSDKSIVKPNICEDSYLPGPVVIMSATESDFKLLNSISGNKLLAKRKLYTSNINIYETYFGSRYSIVGPFIGAPYVAMLIETLLAWGVSRLFFIGWCGSIHETIEIGDIIIPDGAIIDEGTSCHYCDDTGSIALPFSTFNLNIINILKKEKIPFHNGLVWTTDAIFRETLKKVNYFKRKGAIAVEMELSAIFNISRFYNIESTGILIVSDVLKSYNWFPGFKTKAFKKSRNFVCKMISELCCELI